MAVTKAYTDETKLETYLNKTITDGDADDAINGAVDLIDQLTDRNFIADTTATYRRYDGNDGENLLIDECVEVTEVKLGLTLYGDSTETLTANVSNGYYVLPRDYSERGKPITEIHLRGRGWTLGTGNHQIKAKWGYSASVPAAIELATTILAAGIYNSHRGGVGNKKSEKIGNYAVTYTDESGWTDFEKAKDIVQQYRKISL